MSKYKIGDIVKCKVTGLENYGIFVNIDDNYKGLIHISEITYNYVRNINDYAQIGDYIFAEIIEIEESAMQLRLSIKDIDYKNTGQLKRIIESEHGFKPLEEMLPKWTCDKLTEIKESAK